jgi:hypothetical protein
MNLPLVAWLPIALYGGLLLLIVFGVVRALIKAWMRDIDLEDPEQRAWVRNWLKTHYPEEQ